MIEISTALSGIIAGKEKIPIARVEAFDTTYTVPSSGFFVRYFSGVEVTGYLNPGSETSLKRTQFEPSIYKDWSNGLPVELSNYLGANIASNGIVTTDPWSVSYSGWFFSEITGVYKFGTRSTGGTEIYVSGIQLLTGLVEQPLGVFRSSNDVWQDKDKYWEGEIELAKGWTPIEINFRYPANQGSGISDPMLTAFYTSPDENRGQRVLSASVVNIHPQFIDPVNFNNVMFVSQSEDEERSNSYSFEVAILKTGDYNWTSDKDNFGNLKSNRLVNIYMGYATEDGYNATEGYTTNLSGTTDFVKKFTGLIDSVKVSENAKSVTATVSCRDFTKKLINAINENYPNKASYTPTVLNEIDPFGLLDVDNVMPNAYDNWTVFDVITDLSLHAEIDPQHLDRDKWDRQNYFKMESNLNYPSTTTVDFNGIQTLDGDPFIFQFEYGEKLLDLSKRASDLIGFQYRFDKDGDLTLREPRSNHFIEVYETGNYGSKAVTYKNFDNTISSSEWGIYIDINARNRINMRPFVGGTLTRGKVEVQFSGVGFSTYQTVHPSGERYTVEITRDSDGFNVFSGEFTNSGTFQNAQKQEYTSTLPYDGYTALISPSGDYRLEGFSFAERNPFRPLYTLRDDVDIRSLNIDLNDDSVRNEVIAVGQQIGDKSYLYSKAIDLDSISNPEAFNYVGEKKTINIIEPTIHSQRRLDWLSSNVLQKYKRKQRNISITCQGLPHLETGDPVGIVSDKLNLDSLGSGITYDIDNNEIYYVRSISSRLEKKSYTTNLQLTSLKPIESWTPSIGITSDVLAAIYAQNDNTIFSHFRQVTLNAKDGGYGYDGFSNQAAFVDFNMFVDVDRLYVLISDAENGGEIFKTINIRDKSPLISWQAGNGAGPDDPPQGAVWLHNGGGERWGKVTVPTAQNDFNGGQWAGQNSESKVRKDGTYPIAIWAQFRTADQALYYQGIWVPESGVPEGNPDFTDNRNRTLSNTTSDSSDINMFYAYSFVPGVGVSFAPDPTFATEAYLPAFVVKNEKLKTNMWMGPKSSGYQMVGDNILLDMSSKFDHNGDIWNMSELGPGWHWYPDSDQRVFTYDGCCTWAVASESPWNLGSDMMEEGIPALGNWTALNMLSVKTGALFKGSKAGKQAYGWSPQGFDLPTTKPDYLHDGVTWVPGKSSETVMHAHNYITFTFNHDTYMSYERQYCWQAKDGSVLATTMATYNMSVPVRGPISLYLYDPREMSYSNSNKKFFGHPGDYASGFYKDPSTYFRRYPESTNYIEPTEFLSIGQYVMTHGTPWSAWEGRVVHTFKFKEAQTGRNYYTVMSSTDANQGFGHWNEDFADPVVRAQFDAERSADFKSHSASWAIQHHNFVNQGTTALRML